MVINKVYIYSVITYAHLNKTDCRMTISELTLFWLLQEMQK